MANQSTRPAGLAGIGWLLMGLLLGLLIGWVVWPVEWYGASINDLRPDARAHFVSATADAYVASGGQDPATTLARMQGFADPQAAVLEAIAFYQQSSDPNRAIREVNLRSLASALNARPNIPAPSPEAIGWLNWILAALAALLLLAGGIWIGQKLWSQPTSARPRSTGPVPPAVDPATRTPASTQGQTQIHPPAPAGASASEPAATVAHAPQPASGWRPVAPDEPASRSPIEQVASQRQLAAPVTLETWDTPHDALPETQTDLPASAPDTQGTEEITRIRPSREYHSTQPGTEERLDDRLVADRFGEFTDIGAGTTSVVDDKDDDDDNDDDDDTGWIDDWDKDTIAPEDDRFGDEFGDELYDSSDEESDEENGEETDDTVKVGFPYDNVADDDEEYDGENEDDPALAQPRVELPWASDQSAITPLPKTPVAADQDKTEDEQEIEGFLPTVRGVLGSWRGEKKPSVGQRAGNEISTHVAEYNVGMDAYSQSFTITSSDDEDGKPLGACGMGINESLDKSAANTTNVHVLDVWLYDGVDVRSYSQFLISPGMDGESLAAQARSAATITGEPLEIASGVTFRLTAKHLVLDCRIVKADVLRDDIRPSPLRTVQVEMKARVTK